MKAIKFIENHSPYAAGDIAGFEEKVAAALIAAGKAIEFKAEKKKSEKEDK